MINHYKGCMKCEKRYPGCQDVCPQGVQAKLEHDKEVAMVRKARGEEIRYTDYCCERAEKEKRKWNK